MSEALGAASGAPELQLERIEKSFGSTKALRGASLLVRPGTVHALLGENGAGKTTLVRVAFGLLHPDSGRITLDGREVRLRSPADAIRAGIGMVHQHFTNVGAMTVAENVALGGHGRYAPRTIVERLRGLASTTRLPVDPLARVDALSVASQQKVEILKALARNAKVLILDEPTAVLAPAEARELLAWVQAFARGGGSVILITHKLSEALATADEVTVMRYGESVLTAATSRVTAEVLATAMIGAASATSQPTTPRASGDVVLRVSSVTIVDARGVRRVSDANLEVREHEILGIAGLENSGHELLLRAIAGRLEPAAGQVHCRGATALIPEDRQRDALILGFSLVENLALKGAGRRRGRMPWSRLRARTASLTEEYDVRATSIESTAGALSGGNQQKLVLARELSDDPALIVAENPTRGLDIRATADVHERLRAAAARGAAVVVYASDLDEVLSLATRVVAMHRGRLVAVPNEREAVGRAMLGVQ